MSDTEYHPQNNISADDSWRSFPDIEREKLLGPAEKPVVRPKWWGFVPSFKRLVYLFHRR
jgi:hypothetical protein